MARRIALRRPLVEHRIPLRFRFMQRQASVQRPARVVDPVRVEHMRRPVRIEHQPQLQAVMVATACYELASERRMYATGWYIGPGAPPRLATYSMSQKPSYRKASRCFGL